MLKGKVKTITYLDHSYGAGKEYLQFKSIVEFDKNGYELSQTNYSPDTIMSITAHEYKFNSDGNKTEQTQLDEQERIPGWIKKYTYDKSKRLTETNRYSQEGKLYQRVVYKYDEKGNNIAQYSYSGEGGSQGIELFKYDHKGNLVESHDRGTGDSGSVYTVRYSDKGALLTAHHEFDGNSFFTKDYIYGQVKYDKTGNWIEMMAIEKNARGIDTTIRRRIITYY